MHSWLEGHTRDARLESEVKQVDLYSSIQWLQRHPQMDPRSLWHAFSRTTDVPSVADVSMNGNLMASIYHISLASVHPMVVTIHRVAVHHRAPSATRLRGQAGSVKTSETYNSSLKCLEEA